MIGTPSSGDPDDSQPTYVHVSGGMFAMIPDNKTVSPRNRDGTHVSPLLRVPQTGNLTRSGSNGSNGSSGGIGASSVGNAQNHHNEYIRCCIESGVVESANESAYFRTGFLWSWNFMLTKRWRTSHTGDEAFQDKVLADFRAFCRNDEGRLKKYWDESMRRARGEKGSEEEGRRMSGIAEEEEEALIGRMIEGRDAVVKDLLLCDD